MPRNLRWTLYGAALGGLAGLAAYTSGGSGEALEGRMLLMALLTFPGSLAFAWLADVWPHLVTEWLFILGAPALQGAFLGLLAALASRERPRPAV